MMASSSMDNTSGDAKDSKMADLESKNALLTAQNQILESKLEKQQLQARIHELMEENAALKQTNVEQKANEQKIDEFMKQLQAEIADLKAKNQEDMTTFGKKLEDAEHKVHGRINELEQVIRVNEIRMESLAEGIVANER